MTQLSSSDQITGTARRKLNITFVLPLANMSGGIRVISIYASALKQMGHHVELVSIPPRTPSMRQRIKSFFKLDWTPVRAPTSHLDAISINHRVIESCRPITDADVQDADVVIATWWETAEWVHKMSPTKGAKVYFVQHHEVFNNLPLKRCRATYRLPLKKITIARWLVDTMQREYGDTDVDLVPNAVDHAQFFAGMRSKQKVPTVGFLFHEAHFKGVDIALTAIAKIRCELPDLRVLSFGSHPPSKHIELPEYVEFHLNPPQAAIRDIYAQCDVWITCSRSEGFNLPAMEAMACRTPVVSTKTGWPDEAIQDGNNGYLAGVDDADGIACAAQSILNLPNAAWEKMSEEAFATVEKSSWDTSSHLFEMSLQRAAATNVQPPTNTEH